MEVRWTYASSSTIGEMSLGNFASDELQLGKSNRFPPRFKLTLEPRLASPCLIEFRINCFYSSHPRPVSLSLFFSSGEFVSVVTFLPVDVWKDVAALISPVELPWKFRGRVNQSNDRDCYQRNDFSPRQRGKRSESWNVNTRDV